MKKSFIILLALLILGCDESLSEEEISEEFYTIEKDVDASISLNNTDNLSSSLPDRDPMVAISDRDGRLDGARPDRRPS